MTSIIATPVSIPMFCDKTTDKPPPSSKKLLSSGSCVKDEKKKLRMGEQEFDNKKDTSRFQLLVIFRFNKREFGLILERFRVTFTVNSKHQIQAENFSNRKRAANPKQLL